MVNPRKVAQVLKPKPCFFALRQSSGFFVSYGTSLATIWHPCGGPTDAVQGASNVVEWKREVVHKVVDWVDHDVVYQVFGPLLYHIKYATH
ncbi:MAG: hypothetical protein CL902_01215 [Dehalococcoidia bacterium]|nr:hypothetical protein [Dehalococcoidia bacterium]